VIPTSIHKKDEPKEGEDSGKRSLTADQIVRTVQAVLRDDSRGRLKNFVTTCNNCSLCSEACQYLISNGHDPQSYFASQIKKYLGELILNGGRVSPDLIRRMAKIVYAEVDYGSEGDMRCPFGGDVGYLMGVGKSICQELGVTPQNTHKGAPKVRQRRKLS
jgi:hypothetical protein